MFKPDELQFIYDAVLNFSIRPEFANSMEVDTVSDDILVKVEKALAEMGYVYAHVEAYAVDQH